jgi:hypothetical protein
LSTAGWGIQKASHKWGNFGNAELDRIPIWNLADENHFTAFTGKKNWCTIGAFSRQIGDSG